MTGILSALIAAIVALILKPTSDFMFGRYRSTIVFQNHMADRIRDFRESVAVLESIILIGKTFDDDPNRKEGFPVDTHLEKVAVPDHLVTNRAIDLSFLNDRDHSDGIELSNLLVNISRDVKSLIQSKRDLNREGFDVQIDELAVKLRNLADKWERLHPVAKRIFDVKGTDTKNYKKIMFEDGDKIEGVMFENERPKSLADRKLKSEN